MEPARARERFAAARVARLATADAEGRPHVVPVTYAVRGDVVYHAVDHKPKRTRALRRLSNITANPAVALLADGYDDHDWTALWWVRAEGRARLLDAGGAEGAQAVALLQERYVQYREQPPAGVVVAVDVGRWSGWLAAP